LRGLHACGQTIDDCMSTFILYTISTKLDLVMRQEFDYHITDTNRHPTFQKIHRFLLLRCSVVNERSTDKEKKSIEKY